MGRVPSPKPLSSHATPSLHIFWDILMSLLPSPCTLSCPPWALDTGHLLNLVSPQLRGSPDLNRKPELSLMPRRQSLLLFPTTGGAVWAMPYPKSPGSAPGAPDCPSAPGQAEPSARGLPAGLLLRGRAHRLCTAALPAPGQHHGLVHHRG